MDFLNLSQTLQRDAVADQLRRAVGDWPKHLSGLLPSTGDPMPGSSSIWSSAALVALTKLTATRVPASPR